MKLTALLQLAIMFTITQCYPIQRYNPNIYYGPYLSQDRGDIEELPRDYFDRLQDLQTMLDRRASPYLRGKPGHDTDEDGWDEEISPELARLITAYSMLKDFEENHETTSGPAEGAFNVYGNQQRKSGQLGKDISKKENQAPITKSAMDDGAEGQEEDEEPMSNRRTFGLIVPAFQMGIKMIDQDLGLGMTDTEISSTTTQQLRLQQQQQQTKAQMELLREEKEKAAIEQLQTQAQLEQMRAENEMISRNSRAELDAIRSKFDSVASQAEKERKEKEELRIRLENESRQRDRENEDLKIKLTQEETKRERERLRMEAELIQQRALAEKQNLEMKRKWELETAMQSKKVTEEINQKSIRDYRAPATVGLTYPS